MDLRARHDGTLELAGLLTFETVPDYYGQTDTLFNAGAGAVVVDLGQVTRADSAGLALLVEWAHRAQAVNRRIEFRNLPEQMRHLIEVSGLTRVLV